MLGSFLRMFSHFLLLSISPCSFWPSSSTDFCITWRLCSLTHTHTHTLNIGVEYRSTVWIKRCLYLMGVYDGQDEMVLAVLEATGSPAAPGEQRNCLEPTVVTICIILQVLVRLWTYRGISGSICCSSIYPRLSAHCSWGCWRGEWLRSCSEVPSSRAGPRASLVAGALTSWEPGRASGEGPALR